MKKVLSIFALAIFAFGLTSCEAETNLEETEALYIDMDASEDDDDPASDRRGSWSVSDKSIHKNAQDRIQGIFIF